MIERVGQIAQAMAEQPGALLPVLHAIQDEFGYIPEESVPTLARVLNLSRAEVHGVISFYHLFRTSPPGEKTIYICRAESCQAMGSAALEELAREQLGIDYHQTSADGRISLEPVYCLGNCACSPSVMVNEELHSRVTSKDLRELLES